MHFMLVAKKAGFIAKRMCHTSYLVAWKGSYVSF